GVDVDISALLVRDGHRFERAVEDGTEQVVALLALGDVDEEALLEDRLAVGPIDRVHLVEHPADGAIGSYDPVLELERITALAGEPLCPCHELEVLDRKSVV